ncbi:MAG: cation/multidrug efflux pump [Devosia sp.]|uniref:efflux RND transporter permease subunit n=1 Tax=Devosia sp. TaxID=1871048 RepID=UPI00262FA605|nr:efflux RND transporter permease subunit [Devosia sp.]MDB5541381.1 cation/multidrug efflux pump [Devosia sp.]
MNLSAIFIGRPVATTLLALGMVLAGIFSYLQLPVSALPQVDYPTITVTDTLPGASPQTMAISVTTPLIKALNTIPGVTSITATSTAGTTTITMQFDLSVNIDVAANNVQEGLASVVRRLPLATTAPTYRKANPSAAPILLIALQSPSLSQTDLGGLAQNVIVPNLSAINGVAEVLIGGAKTFAIRIQVDPAKMAARNLTMLQVATAVAQATNQTPLGSINTATQSILINSTAQLANVEQFNSLVVALVDGNPVYLSDVARVINSVDNVQTSSSYDGQPATIIAVIAQPNANTVQVIDAIKAQMPQLQAQLPSSTTLSFMNDSSLSIRAAVADVETSLMVTLALVIMVIYLFLGHAVTTLVPAVAIPLSLIGALSGMYVLGFSIDNLSLLAITLSVGLVVDDAIVVVENVIRHIEEGKRPMEAALIGSREVAGTIVSMSLSLIAVFIPILLMGGVVGRLFNEFGVVVSLSIALSALVSLTVTPMMAARLPGSSLKPPSKRSPAGLFDGAFRRILGGYDRSIGWCLRHKWLIVLIFLGSVVASGWLMGQIPTTFLPQEDTGQVQINLTARTDASYQVMASLQAEALAAVRANPAVAHVASQVSNNSLNTGQLSIQLTPKNTRPPMAQTLAQLRAALARVPGITATILPVQSLRLGNTGSGTYQLVVEALDPSVLPLWTNRILQAMTADTQNFAQVTPDAQTTALEANVVVNRDASAALDVTTTDILTAIQAGFGSVIVTTIQTAGNSTNVYLENDPTLPDAGQLLSTVMVPTSSGTQVPLSSVATVSNGIGAVAVNQTGQFVSSNISFNVPNGVGLGQVFARIDQIKTEIGLPSSVFTTYNGAAQVFATTMASQPMLIGAAVLAIFIVLGVLYESFIQPLTILSGLPAAALGALLALVITGTQLSVIAIIGIFMLIGIVMKNGIMMVDVALVLKREENLAAADAIRQAATRRFRPIMMTTLCAIFGALPIALGTGASAELRQPLGIVVVGGLVFSQLLTLFITPVIFVELDRVGTLGKSLRARFFPKRSEVAGTSDLGVKGGAA